MGRGRSHESDWKNDRVYVGAVVGVPVTLWILRRLVSTSERRLVFMKQIEYTPPGPKGKTPIHWAAKRKRMQRALKRHAEKTWAAERAEAKKPKPETILQIAIRAIRKWWTS